jgi:hypothetical protein
MASTYKVLAQSAPSATTNTDVYTVESGKSAVVSTITVCNRSASAARIVLLFVLWVLRWLMSIILLMVLLVRLMI